MLLRISFLILLIVNSLTFENGRYLLFKEQFAKQFVCCDVVKRERHSTQ